jgi:hypothetical protein
MSSVPLPPDAGPSVPCGACGRALAGTPGAGVKCRCGRTNRVYRFAPVRTARLARPLVSGTPCAYHAGNAAVAGCARCGSFVCDLCVTPASGATYCTACFERLRAEGGLPGLQARYPRPHLLAFLVSLLSFLPFAVLLTLPAAAWYGRQAFRARHQIALRESWLWAYLASAALLVALGGVLSVALIQQARR